MNTTTIQPLPQPADLQLMEQAAADLAAALRANEPMAVSRWDQYHKFIKKKVPQDIVPDPAEAPQIVAREYGFADWETLKAFIVELGRQGSPVQQFEAAVDAIVEGQELRLRHLLENDPGLVVARSKRVHEATLLHYTAANGIEDYRQKTPPNIVQIADMLLKAGAEVDVPLMDGGRGTTLGEVATSMHPARAGVQLELMELLLAAGAAVDGQPGGWQPLMAALANARPEAAALLADRGAYMTIVAAAGLGREALVKQYFNAEGEYMPTREKTWHVPEEPEAQLVRAFMYACIYGHTAIAAWLIGKGVDPGVQDWGEYTGLHWAAHGGHIDTVKYLLEKKVPLELQNCYGGTVLGQLLWSASNNAGGWGGNKPDADYPVIAEMLIVAGAEVEPGTLAWWRGLKDVVAPVYAGMEEVLRRQLDQAPDIGSTGP